MLRIGQYDLHTIETGTFGLDGGAMFGVVPKTIWSKTNPADDQNRIQMHGRCLLLRDVVNGRNILVDCGMGAKWSARHRDIYAVSEQEYSLDRSLAALGLRVTDITDVILTHLHFDHAGGLTRRDHPTDATSPLVPVFPNAKVHLQARNWEYAQKPTEKDRASYLKENFELYGDAAAHGRNLSLIDTRATEPTGRSAFSGPDSAEDVILPGISVEVSHGHTLGMQLVRVSAGDGGPSLVYGADLIPTATHVRVPFIMAYDCFPIFLLEEKKRLLNRAVDENTWLFFEHCPRMAAARVVRDPKGDFTVGESLVTF